MARKDSKRSCKHWTKDEVDYILDGYTKTPLAVLAYYLERSEGSVKKKLETLT